MKMFKINKKTAIIGGVAIVVVLGLGVGLGVGLSTNGNTNINTQTLNFTTSNSGDGYGRTLRAPLNSMTEPTTFNNVNSKNKNAIELSGTIVDYIELSVLSGSGNNQRITFKSLSSGNILLLPISPLTIGTDSSAIQYSYAELIAVQQTSGDYNLIFIGLAQNIDPTESNLFLVELNNDPSINITFALKS